VDGGGGGTKTVEQQKNEFVKSHWWNMSSLRWEIFVEKIHLVNMQRSA